ncbi:MAG TPA: hypothetical protein VNO70_16315 [Blastocatellia bacterium]|nr:hypothetical protein [Blastocatellia bacterium]
MNTQAIFMRLGCAAMLAALAFAPSAQGQNGNGNPKPKISFQPILAFSDQSALPGGGSILARAKDGVYMSYHSFGLPAGTVATAWWVFFNEPKRCATSPCGLPDLFTNPDAQPSLVYATGRMVGADGTADFGAFRAVGDTTGAQFGPGLLDPRKAEIHLVIRTHGPALDDPALLSQQLSSFNGGCPTPNTCANLQVSIHQP